MLILIGATYALSSLSDSAIQGRLTLVIKEGTNHTPQIIEPEWTPQNSVLDLDIKDVTVEPNGATLVLGETIQKGEQKFVIARYSPNDSIDPTFGIRGATFIDFPTGDYRDQKIVLHKDRIEILGTICSFDYGCQSINAKLSRNGFIIQDLTLLSLLPLRVGALEPRIKR